MKTIHLDISDVEKIFDNKQIRKEHNTKPNKACKSIHKKAKEHKNIRSKMKSSDYKNIRYVTALKIIQNRLKEDLRDYEINVLHEVVNSMIRDKDIIEIRVINIANLTNTSTKVVRRIIKLFINMKILKIRYEQKRVISCKVDKQLTIKVGEADGE